MACCKCCCGNKTCAEGEIGKCCCGGPTGSCCTASQYCCSGTCQSTPCGGACCDPVFGCTQVASKADCDELHGDWLGYGVPCGDPDPCSPYWCQLQLIDDNIQCVLEPDSDRAVIKRRGTLFNGGGNADSCVQPGESCYGCYGYATFCWDGTVPAEWQDYVTSCAEISATVRFNIETYLTNNFGCQFDIVEKKRSGRGGLDSYPSSVINIAFLGCCKQGEVAGMSLEPRVLFGPGTELKKLLSKIGITASPTCSCNAKAKVMDERGIAWCEENVETICDWLQEEATNRKLPFVRLAGKALIHMAIRRAKKGTNK